MTDDREQRAMANAALAPGHPAGSWEGLVLFLDGMPSSFTGQLLTLIEKADPGNRARLAEAFPFEVRAWETWRRHSPQTWGELAELLKEGCHGH
jgi:hypothetical protein